MITDVYYDRFSRDYIRILKIYGTHVYEGYSEINLTADCLIYRENGHVYVSGKDVFHFEKLRPAQNLKTILMLRNYVSP